MFIDPPLARVGLSEREARDARIPVRVAKLPTKAVLRTRTTSDNVGFMKALVGDDDRIVGFTMIGSEAGEVMAAHPHTMTHLYGVAVMSSIGQTLSERTIG
jgi:pyruvate/2-oxoglutarate dehydrogenase complex dihydrolipoamide dehydrogenase (E3) component